MMLSASPTDEAIGPSDNSKLMLSEICQKDLNSSMDMEEIRLLTEGSSRLGPLLRPT